MSENDHRCIALTKSGSRCKNRVQEGSSTCHVHHSLSAEEDPATTEEVKPEAAPVELWQELLQQLNELIARVRLLDPTYAPAPAAEPDSTLRGNGSGDRAAPRTGGGFLSRMLAKLNRDLLDPEMWQGMWYMANHTVSYQADMARRRIRGEYETDDWGLDWEFLEAIRPFLDFLYKVYWRVEATGIDKIPDYDRAILVCNQSGQMPWDSLMIMTAVLAEHPAQRLVRNLYAEWFPTIPFLSSALVKIGQTLASEENGIRLLNQDELVCVYPEGYLGFSKQFNDRYKLKRFVWSDFVKMAIRTQSPIIPVSVVGAEESYIRLANIPGMEKVIGFPYLPITLRFPMMGLLGTVPLPTKWYIDVGEATSIENYGPEEAENLVLVSKLADQTRDSIQALLDARLTGRRSAFY